MSHTRSGPVRQSRHRTALRVVGFAVLAIGLYFAISGLVDFLTVDDFEQPTRFWMLFVGLPLIAVGGWCLMIGFLGVAARYAAGEAVPVLRDSLGQLQAQRFCSSCGRGSAADARFCSGCGSAQG